MISDLLNRYIWLTDTIYSAGEISLAEINRKWERCTLNDAHDPLPRRTFCRWKDEIEMLFGLVIDYIPASKSYRIANRDDIKNSATQQWMLQTFAVTNLVHAGKSIQDRILLENMPSDAMYLSPIMEAIRTGKKLRMTYKKFLAAEPHTFVLEPFCLKAFKQRWYVAGRPDEHPDEIRVYGLDRVQNLDLTEEDYTIPEDFDAQVFFHNYYGIWHDVNTPAENIIIRVTTAGANYLRSLPLHHSQKEIETTPDYACFQYYIAPTFDFIQELRTHGQNLKVLVPQWLADRMKADAIETTKVYEK